MSSIEAGGQHAVPPPGAGGTAGGAPGVAVPPGGGPGGPQWWAVGGGHAAGRRWRGRWMVASAVIVVAVAGAGAAGVSGAFGAGGAPGTASSGHGTGTAVVTRQSLISQTQVDGTLGDAGAYDLVVPPSGSSGSGAAAGAGPRPGAGAGAGTASPAPAAGKTPGTPAPSRTPAPTPTPTPTPTVTPTPTPSPSPGKSSAARSRSPGPGTPAGSSSPVPSPSTSTAGPASPSPGSAYWLDALSLPGSAAPGTGSGSGTFTWLPGVGQAIGEGQVAYRVSGRAVVLLYGQVPVYRALAEGNRGVDVSQLNHDLVALGYATRAGISGGGGWGLFSWRTRDALEGLQSRLGQKVTGRLGLGTAVFLPGAVLVTGLGSGAVLGGPASPGSVVATASSRTPVVTINLDPSMQSQVKAGDRVGITLPDGAGTGGVVSQISTVASASASGSPGSGNGPGPGNGPGSGGGPVTITVTVSLDHPSVAGRLNSAPVTVNITTGSVSSALVVPVTALVAQAGGGYAVEVIGVGRRHRLVKVTPGLFDDAAGTVAVTGALAPGQRVVVAGS